MKFIIFALCLIFVIAKDGWKKTTNDNLIAGITSEGLDYIVDKYPPRKSVFNNDPILEKAGKIPIVGSYINTVKNAAVIGEKLGEMIGDHIVKKQKNKKKNKTKN
jgi:hypothetical protein